ncbi:MAG TPA: tetratricopeptide repeat protein [Candidatus Mcinerneyibacterium sp.]|nr:tetratricopeptide repeat protein [Candidatus Mcinerneyibacterium sp.]
MKEIVIKKKSLLIIASVFIFFLFAGCSRKNLVKREISYQDSQIYINYLKLKEKDKNTDKQKKILLNLKNKYPENKQIKRDLINLYFQSKKYKKALNITNELLKVENNNVEILYKKAKLIEIIYNKFPKSIYKKIIEIDKNIQYALVKLSNHELENKNFKIALKYYIQLFKESNNRYVFKKIVYLSFVTGQHSNLYTLIEENSNKKELKKEIINYIILTENELKIFDFIVTNYNRFDEDFKIQLMFSFFYKLDKKNKILNYFQKYLDSKLDINEIKFFLATYFFQNKNKNDDIKGMGLVKELIKAKYKNKDIYTYLFRYDIDNKSYEELLIHYDKYKDKFSDEKIGLKILYQLVVKNYNKKKILNFANKINYNEIEEQYLLSLFYNFINLRKYKIANNLADIINPEYFSSKYLFSYYFIRLQLSSNLKNIKEMRDYFSKAKKIEPNNSNLLNYYGYSLLLVNGDYQNALNILLKALKLEPDSPAINDSVGWAYYKMGMIEKAEKYINVAIEKVSDDPEILYHKSQIELEKNNLEKALEYLKKVKDIDDERLYYIDIDEEIKKINRLINN